jgi:hypothetical protein
MVAFSASILQAGNIIDSTHIIAREIELPKVNRAMGPAGLRSGIQFADTNPEETGLEKDLGQKEMFWVRNIQTGNFEKVTAVLRAIGEHCYVFLQDTQDVSQEAINRIQDQFDNQIYKTNTEYFGFEWKPGIDNDNRINLLMVDIQDGYSDPDDGYVAGYFFAGDEMRQSDFPPHSKVRTNEREIVYLDTYPCDPEADDYLEVVAHEFQHMIHYNQDNEEVTWVNEGCSQIAPVLCGFSIPGHYKLLKNKSDRSLNNWAKWDPMPDYGQVYLWNQYIVEKVLKDDESRKTFFRALTASKFTSITGYKKAFETTTTNFSDVFTAFSIANHINDPALENGRFSYEQAKLENFKIPRNEFIESFPKKISDSVNVWGSDSFEADLSKLSGPFEVSFSGYKRFLGPTYPYFKVAMVFQDTSKQVLPVIKFINLKQNPSDQNRLIGSQKVKLASSYDRMTIVVMALAPEDVDDTKYMPASPFIYDLNIKEITPNAAISPEISAGLSEPMSKFVLGLVAAIKDPDLEKSMAAREYYSNLLIKAVKSDLETSSFKTIDEFINCPERVSNKLILAPMAYELSSLLKFELSHANTSQLDKITQRIKQLNSL